MGLRLIRQKSETPNILSTDDARMVRYAYGGYDGVVKNRGTECGYEASGNTFKITSGVIVLQGWEVEIDGNGWQITVDSMTKYYAVYLEVNLSTDTAEIKSVYDTTGIPAVNVGDDLTRTTNGTARMVLYTFKTMGDTISNVVKKVENIRYLKEIADELGFKEASVENGEITLEADWADASIADGYPQGKIIKQGKCAVLSVLEAKSATVSHEQYSIDVSGNIGKIPSAFCPKEDTKIIGKCVYYFLPFGGTYFTSSFDVSITIKANGEMQAVGSATNNSMVIVTKQYPAWIRISNAGWLLP